MSISIRMQIIAAIQALLSGTGTPAINIDRTRLETYTVDQVPAYNIIPDDEETTQDFDGGATTERLMKFKVICLTVAANAADLAIDPLYLFAVQNIHADPTLGGLCNWVKEGSSKYSLEHGAGDIVGLEVDFSVEYYTSFTDPSVSKS